jgi:alkylated DNA repair dioxygenase AlkB
MTLTETEKANLLPYDGIAVYYGPVLPPRDADRYFCSLMSGISWKPDEAVIFGRHIITKRKVAWYADRPFAYTYSNKTRVALPWTLDLLDLRRIAERVTGATFNSCLLNLYHSGDEGMGWHRDDETTLAPNSSIASISLGAERRFHLKHRKSKKLVSVVLEHGSLLEMKGETQEYWWHSLPRSAKVPQPRINLTFRTMLDP